MPEGLTWPAKGTTRAFAPSGLLALPARVGADWYRGENCRTTRESQPVRADRNLHPHRHIPSGVFSRSSLPVPALRDALPKRRAGWFRIGTGVINVVENDNIVEGESREACPPAEGTMRAVARVSDMSRPWWLGRPTVWEPHFGPDTGSELGNQVGKDGPEDARKYYV
jgi:hypothetical protein